MVTESQNEAEFIIYIMLLVISLEMYVLFSEASL